MKDLEEKCFRFVLKHYRVNKLDTQKALQTFRHKHAIPESKSGPGSYVVAFAGIAAAVLLVFVIKIYLFTDAKWTEITAYEHSVDCLLPDSSAVMLYPHSSIRYCSREYLSVRRDVRLRGKASFRVRHHAARPFTASGRLSEVRVLGTRFLLDESRNDTAFVHVEEGKVQYTVVGQPDAVILTRGMGAQVVKGQRKPQVLTQGVQTRKGSFVFSNTPLQKVLDELSRYYNVRLTADNTDKRLTANFNSRSLDEIIEIIEKVLKVKIEKKK